MGFSSGPGAFSRCTLGFSSGLILDFRSTGFGKMLIPRSINRQAALGMTEVGNTCPSLFQKFEAAWKCGRLLLGPTGPNF